MNSLRTRLALMIVLVTTAAVAAVGLLSSRVTTNEFRHYVDFGDSTTLERYGAILTDYYSHNNCMDRCAASAGSNERHR